MTDPKETPEEPAEPSYLSQILNVPKPAPKPAFPSPVVGPASTLPMLQRAIQRQTSGLADSYPAKPLTD